MGVSSGSIDRDIVAKINLWKESRCHPCKGKHCFTPWSLGLTLLLPLASSPKMHFFFLSIFLGSTLFQVCLNSSFQCTALLWPSCWAPNLWNLGDLSDCVLHCIPYTALVSYFPFAHADCPQTDNVNPGISLYPPYCIRWIVWNCWDIQ